MRKRWLKLGALVLALILILLGLRLLVAPAFISTPDTVHIVVTDVQLPSPNGTVIFDHQYSHQASEIYQQLIAGVQYDSSHVASCPGISTRLPFYHYQLTFFHLGVKVATATSDANGCAAFAVGYPDGSVAYHSWETNDHISFWVRLHQMVNAPEPINAVVGTNN